MCVTQPCNDVHQSRFYFQNILTTVQPQLVNVIAYALVVEPPSHSGLYVYVCIDEMEEESEEVIAVNQNQDESDEVCRYADILHQLGSMHDVISIQV